MDTEAANDTKPLGCDQNKLSLPDAAPCPFADYRRARDAWMKGDTTTRDIALCYGEETAKQLITSWGENKPSTTEADHQHDQDEAANETNSGEMREQDDTALLSTYHLGIGTALAGRLTAGMEVNPEVLSILREHLHRMRGEGMTTTEQVSTLYYLIEQREVPEYTQEFPDLMQNLGLDVDVNLDARCMPGPTPVMRWMESELWETFLDWYEGTIGFESEALQNMRGSPTLPASELEEWRVWSGMIPRRQPRSRSRTPQRDHRGPGQRPEEGDASSLMHWDNREDSRHREGTRRRRTHVRGERGRERSREGRGGRRVPSTREERVRSRVTQEVRQLVPRHCPESEPWEPSGTGASASTEPPRGGSRREPDMDIIQATGRWFKYFGLRQRGQENHQPANAMTRELQHELQEELRGLSEWNLGMMNRALLRLMGMLFIESARVMIQVQELRLRAQSTELVEVEIEEDDDESLYMQLSAKASTRTWSDLLSQLVQTAGDGNPGRRCLMEGLRRRIAQSLYLESDKGAQLHATLVSAAADLQDENPVSCDTADNDQVNIEKWWEELKKHMTFGEAATCSASSGDIMVRTGSTKETEGHSCRQVQAWEAERQSETVIDLEPDAELVECEEEEERQNQRDLELFLSHEAGVYQNWEDWVLLNTPNRAKRRRLLVSVPQPGVEANSSVGPVEASLPLPAGTMHFEINLKVQHVDEPVAPPTTTASLGTPEGTTDKPLDINSEVYNRAYETWKDGLVSDTAVERIFGADWLFLFQVTHAGVEDSTLAPLDFPPQGPTTHPANTLEATQGIVATTMCNESEGASAGPAGMWTGQLREGGDGCLDLDDSLDREGDYEGQADELPPSMTGAEDTGLGSDVEGLRAETAKGVDVEGKPA